MTKAQHNYTDPFRRDKPLVKCTICTKPATHTVMALGHAVPVCNAHEPKEATDVREVPGGTTPDH